MESSILNNDDYLQQYRNISAKLRKRFLRKPNVAEASEEFDGLQRSLSDSEVWHGAGLCSIAVGRCQQTLANTRAEADALIHAARCYANAERACSDMLCPTFGDHLLTASSCYRRAIGLHSSNNNTTGGAKPAGGHNTVLADDTSADISAGSSTTAAALTLELAAALEGCGRAGESVAALQSAVDALQHCPVQQCHSLQRLQHCYIKIGDLCGALQTGVRMLELPSDGGQKRESEVLCMLLLLVLQPPVSKTPPSLHTLLQTSPHGPSGPLTSLLQCLIVAVKAKDTAALRDLSAPLAQHLHRLPYHLHLLHLLQLEADRW